MLCVNKGRDTLKFGMVLSFFREGLLLLLRQLGQRETHLVQSRVKPVHTWALVFMTAHVFQGVVFWGFQLISACRSCHGKSAHCGWFKTTER